jgi:hypothetical protein
MVLLPLALACAAVYLTFAPAPVAAVLGWVAVALLIPIYFAAYILLGELTYMKLPVTMGLGLRQGISRFVGIIAGAAAPLLAAVALAKELLK